MTQRQIFITLLLVMSLIVSAFTFSSCEVLNGIFGGGGGMIVVPMLTELLKKKKNVLQQILGGKKPAFKGYLRD